MITKDPLLALIWYCNKNGVENPKISIFQEGEGFRINTWDCGAITQPSDAEANQIVTDYEASSDYYIANFDVDDFQNDLLSALSSFSDKNLRLEFAAMKAFAEAKNFAGMRDYIYWLIQQEVATQGDFTILNNITKSQGVDLENL